MRNVNRMLGKVSAAFAWMVFFSPVAAMAQEAAGSGQGWKESQEQIHGDTMVIAAYMVLWIILMVFVLRIASRQRTLKGDIQELKKVIEDRTAA